MTVDKDAEFRRQARKIGDNAFGMRACYAGLDPEK